MGPVEIQLSDETTYHNPNKNLDEDITWSAQTYGSRIEIYRQVFSDQQEDETWFLFNLIHEFGHVFNNRLQGRTSQWLDNFTIANRGKIMDQIEGEDGRIVERTLGMIPFTKSARLERQSYSADPREVWADTFLSWVYGGELFTDDEAGKTRKQWIKENMPTFVSGRIRANNISGNQGTPSRIKTDPNLPNNSVNFRPAPGLQSVPFSSLPYNANVMVLGRYRDTEWIAVEYHGQKGWILSTEAQISTDSLSPITPECLDYEIGLPFESNPCPEEVDFEEGERRLV